MMHGEALSSGSRAEKEWLIARLLLKSHADRQQSVAALSVPSPCWHVLRERRQVSEHRLKHGAVGESHRRVANFELDPTHHEVFRTDVRKSNLKPTFYDRAEIVDGRIGKLASEMPCKLKELPVPFTISSRYKRIRDVELTCPRIFAPSVI